MKVLVLWGCTFMKSKCFVVLMLMITVEIITGKWLFQNWSKSSRNGLNFDSSKLGYYANLLCTVSNCWWFTYVSLAASLHRLFKEFFSVSRAFCVHLKWDSDYSLLWGLACFTLVGFSLPHWLSQGKLISNEFQ